MYSSKKSIQQLLSLMLAHGITDVVLSPGSRNAPFIHSFSQHPSFRCYTIVDERSAAYFALGLILATRRPVAVCCTSGTALLNYGPAVAEAYYQALPLLVVSADRPPHWVGQADGQTINQSGAFANFVKRSVSLPDPHNSTDEWFCNRLCNEALIALTDGTFGPVHINVPLAEPLYEFDMAQLSPERVIAKPSLRKTLPEAYASAWRQHSKRMVIVGQMLPNADLAEALRQLAASNGTVVLAENTANLPKGIAIESFDAVIATLNADQKRGFAPTLLVTLGGQVVSKRLKQFVRACRPAAHWHIGSQAVDTYQSLTDVLDVEPVQFAQAMANEDSASGSYRDLWRSKAETVAHRTTEYMAGVPYCDLQVFGAALPSIPQGSALHLGNSTPVRYSQLFGLNAGVEVFCNRGTSGIDGVVSTFVGHASQQDRLSYLVVGELSFLYDSNGLWNRYLSPNCRIIVINNGGGGIFRLIDGPSRSEALDQHIAYNHRQSVEDIARAFGVEYYAAHDTDELVGALKALASAKVNRPKLLEVFTESRLSASVYKEYFEILKTL